MKVVGIFFIAALTAIVSQGCSGSNKTETGIGSPNQSAALSSTDTQAAALISDLAYKYGYEAANQRMRIDARNRDSFNCSMAAEYNAISPQVDLPASVAAYCGFLASQGVAVRDCTKAQELAIRLMDDVVDLDDACTGHRHTHRRNRPLNHNQYSGEQQMRKIIKTGMIYRSALGL